MRVGNEVVATFHSSPSKRGAVSGLLAIAVALGWPPASGRGEDRPREIPKDGSWVRYHEEVQDLAKQQKYAAVTTTLSLVGTVIEEGQTCRWLEKKSVLPEGEDGAGTYVVKVLVPEKELWDSETPFAHVRRAWFLRPNEQAMEMPSRSLVTNANKAFRELLLWTPGMLKNSGTAADKSKDIEYQPGRLNGTQARTGTLADDGTGPVRFETSYIAWQHPDLPLGAAEVKITKEGFINRQKTPQWRTSITYRIEDVGTDAKSMLPDNN
jgi:hypothetical protein